MERQLHFLEWAPICLPKIAQKHGARALLRSTQNSHRIYRVADKGMGASRNSAIGKAANPRRPPRFLELARLPSQLLEESPAETAAAPAVAEEAVDDGRGEQPVPAWSLSLLSSRRPNRAALCAVVWIHPDHRDRYPIQADLQMLWTWMGKVPGS